MLLMQVKLTDALGEPITDRMFTVLMYREPASTDEDTEAYHDEVRDRIRENWYFQNLEQLGKLPPGYRMDVDILTFDKNFVAVGE